VFETVIAVLLLIPKTARLGAGLTVVWMTAVILSHIFVLGYGWFFVDALMVMLLAVIYLLLMRRQSHWGESESVGRWLPYKRTKNSRSNRRSSRLGGVRDGGLYPRNQPRTYLLNQSIVRCQARSAAALLYRSGVASQLKPCTAPG
jgi:hypothetical protein